LWIWGRQTFRVDPFSSIHEWPMSESKPSHHPALMKSSPRYRNDEFFADHGYVGTRGDQLTGCMASASRTIAIV
jgi:hypothetical protein